MHTGESRLGPGPKTPFTAVRLDTVPDVARFVREQRERAGLTRRQLAERAGLSESTIAKFERGEALDYPFGRVLRLLRALGARLEAAPVQLMPDLGSVLEEVKAGRNTGPNAR